MPHFPPSEDTVIDLAFRNERTKTLYHLLLDHDLPDWSLVSGCIFQPVWNALTGRAPDYGIRDYDVFYFDADSSYEAEDREIKRLSRISGELAGSIELRNQARVHLWYNEHFGTGTAYSPLENGLAGIDRFLMPCCAIGIYPDPLTGKPRVYAPFGINDLFSMIVRPNEKSVGIQPENYLKKADRWKQCWPEIDVHPYKKIDESFDG